MPVALCRFLPSGPGVSLGLAAFFVTDPLLPNTELNDRSIPVPAAGPFSANLRRFGALPFVPAPFVMPNPTLEDASAALRIALLFP